MPVIIPALCVEVPEFWIYKFIRFRANICPMLGMFGMKTGREIYTISLHYEQSQKFNRIELQTELSLGEEHSDLSSQYESADLRNVEIIFEY